YHRHRPLPASMAHRASPSAGHGGPRMRHSPDAARAPARAESIGAACQEKSVAKYDLVIRGGEVHDGLGSRARKADVGIRDGLIDAIGRIGPDSGPEIDAADCIVTPGFVDIHTHYDGQATWENRLSPSCLHGVTTVVMGNCGVGFAPVRQSDQ